MLYSTKGNADVSTCQGSLLPSRLYWCLQRAFRGSGDAPSERRFNSGRQRRHRRTAASWNLWALPRLPVRWQPLHSGQKQRQGYSGKLHGSLLSLSKPPSLPALWGGCECTNPAASRCPAPSLGSPRRRRGGGGKSCHLMARVPCHQPKKGELLPHEDRELRVDSTLVSLPSPSANPPWPGINPRLGARATSGV